MSEFGNYDGNQNNGPYEKRRAKGMGWVVATMVLVAFMAGALIMRYVPGLGGDGGRQSATPEATVAETLKPVVTPSATLPVLGGENKLAHMDDVDIPAIVKADAPAVVGVLNKVNTRGPVGQGETLAGSGSGIIISHDGYIVTNNHVVEGADSVSVVLSGGEELAARIVGADAYSDLAVLKIERTGLPAIPFGNSDALQVGEAVIAIGNPMGESTLAGTVTHGIISGLNREISIDGYNYKVLQTDAAINPGNSGGALVDADGNLVGINNAKDPAAEGIGFAIPINVAKPVIEQLIQFGGIDRPIIGITPLDISKDQAEFWNVPVGVAIRAVADNGPAVKAGLKEGDIIIEFDSRKVETLSQIRDILSNHKVGDTVKVKVYRDETHEEVTVDLTLGSSLEMSR